MPLAAGTSSAITRTSPFWERALTRPFITSVTYITSRESNTISSGATIGPPTSAMVWHAPLSTSSALT